TLIRRGRLVGVRIARPGLRLRRCPGAVGPRRRNFCGVADVKDLCESRVLIVDDAKLNIDILVQALRDEYKLSVALDGAAALCSIEKSTPDLVLLDIVMPGLNGY